MTDIQPTRIRMRSWLFAPGDSVKKMAKAAEGDADIVIFDLEDA
ncbi:MAG TPA: CoA ester lyase, partial [Erythrobacter sp.]|nr:CoA ester lyase [Erythrobacter sp.]HAW37317.1 CoA ester lyase [Erythrobacter sp.]